MSVISFYDADTGLFHSHWMGPESMVAANTPAGHKAIDGHHDMYASRVDIQTGNVVDYQPAAPSTDHEWDATSKRWQLKPEIAARRDQRAAALDQIEKLERAQARPLRELLINPQNAEAKKRLESIEDQITALRKQLE